MDSEGVGEIDGFGWGDQWACEDFLGNACEGCGLDEVGTAAGGEDEGVALVCGDLVNRCVDDLVGLCDLC